MSQDIPQVLILFISQYLTLFEMWCQFGVGLENSPVLVYDLVDAGQFLVVGCRKRYSAACRFGLVF